MHLRSLVTRYSLLIVAIFFAAGLQAYLWYQSLVHKDPTNTKLSRADDCKDDTTAAAAPAPKENPNKLLFISCGGLEE